MNNSLRTCLTTGVSVMTAAAIALVPSVAAPMPHPMAAPVPAARVVSLPVELMAGVEPTLSGPVSTLLADWLERVVGPPSVGVAFPTPPAPTVPSGTSIDSTIKNVYNAIEPWVRYGFELAQYAVGFIPYVGWLAPQITIFYNFGERIVRSITFNIADFLGGNVSFGQGLRNVGVDTVDAFVQLGRDQLHFFLPNLPPLPPIFPFAAGATTKVDPGVVTSKGTDIVEATGNDVAPTDVKTPEPTDTKAPRLSRLATFVQKFSGRDTSARPRGRGIASGLNSAVRNLVSLATHPLRGRAQAADPAKDG